MDLNVSISNTEKTILALDLKTSMMIMLMTMTDIGEAGDKAYNTVTKMINKHIDIQCSETQVSSNIF